MRVDIFRRPEADNKFSHLAVPAGQPIPQEVTNVDWESQGRGLELSEESHQWQDYGIEHPGRQFKKKGYAITGLHEQTGE